MLSDDNLCHTEATILKCSTRLGSVKLVNVNQVGKQAWLKHVLPVLIP